MSLPDKVHDLGKITNGVNMMVYSHPGVGKTVVAGTSPKAVLIQASGLDTAASAHAFGSKAKRWPVKTWDDMDEVLEYAEHEGKKAFSWWWLDSITLFQELGLDDIMDDLVMAKPHRNLYVPDRGEYGENMNRLSRWVRAMTTLPINFGITAHVGLTSDEEGNEIYMPLVHGRNMPQKICAYMEVVGYLKVAEDKEGEKHRVLYTQPNGKFYAKDGFDAFPQRIVNPSVPKMLALIKKRRSQK